jgi:hypothetical protein
VVVGGVVVVMAQVPATHTPPTQGAPSGRRVLYRQALLKHTPASRQGPATHGVPAATPAHDSASVCVTVKVEVEVVVVVVVVVVGGSSDQLWVIVDDGASETIPPVAASPLQESCSDVDTVTTYRHEGVRVHCCRHWQVNSAVDATWNRPMLDWNNVSEALFELT